ncbi:MAG: DUF4834 family protein [Dysgonamonadaceae bacterium]|jgi:NhaP-type Na+/H+ or K+/H+ antiporter|nr:DUF4834 family protein [Dysgonamonadaceae bacterium]
MIIKFLLFIVFFFILIGILFGFSLFRFLFGGLFRPPKQNKQRVNHQTRNRQNPSKKQKKLIDSNEGEYIDYEEVKD